MKKNILILTLAALTAVIVSVSCGNGQEPVSAATVPVSLSVTKLSGETAQRVITVDDNDWGYTFKYTAVPQWTGSRTIKGTANDPTEFTNGGNIGQFQPGLWLFTIGLYDDEELIYSGVSCVYISKGNTSVTVRISSVTTGRAGSIRIAIKIPAARAGLTDTLTVSWTGAAEGSLDISSEEEGCTVSDDGEGNILFAGTASGLVPGGYTFSYALSHISGKNIILSGEISAVNVREGAAATVAGILEGYTITPLPPARITFADNRAHYALGGESWTSVSIPAARDVEIGDAIGAVTNATATYTLTGVAYSLSCPSTRWYTDAACTSAWNMASPVTRDMTLYAGWQAAAKTVEQTTVNTNMTITVPKFVTSISGSCIGGGGASEYAGKAVNDDYCEVGIYGEGGWGSTGVLMSRAVSGGNTVTLYTGGPAAESYININGSRAATGAAGSSGGSITPRYNIYDYDSSMEKTIVASSISGRPAILMQCANNGSTLLVSGKSIRGSVRFQFYRSSGNSYSGAIKLRISTNGGSSWNAYDEQIGTYKDDDENFGTKFVYYRFVRSSFTQKSVHAYTPSTYGQPGSGGFSVSRGTSYTLGQQAGFRGRCYVTLQ